jgi:hypothetical protein
MEHEPRLRPAGKADISRGAFLAFAFKGQTHVGLAVDPKDAFDPFDVITLYPGRPDQSGQPGIFSGSIIEEPLLVFSDAKIRPSLTPASIRFPLEQGGSAIGALFLTRAGLVISAVADAGVRYFTTNDGKIANSPADRIWFSAWEVGRLNPEGQWQSICAVNVQSVL